MQFYLKRYRKRKKLNGESFHSIVFVQSKSVVVKLHFEVKGRKVIAIAWSPVIIYSKLYRRDLE